MKRDLYHAELGVDINAPSDMMDGRISSISEILEANGHIYIYIYIHILAHSAKYTSNFYDIFHSAVGSKNKLGIDNRYSYRMDSTNSNETLHEIELDINKNANIAYS